TTAEKNAIKKEIASLEKTKASLEAKIRSQEHTPLVDRTTSPEYTKGEIKYEVKIPTSEQMANLRTLSETYKNVNSPEYKKIQSEAQKKLSETPEMKTLNKATQNLNDSIASLQDYAEGYAKQVKAGLIDQATSDTLMKDKAKLVDDANAAVKKAQNAADKVAAELPAHIRKQWLESNGFKL
ncbi:hypothetical protein, partial [Leptospira ilyithenensis]|uniref:hypothetical protein n=1 Tax=Leptospira ilyithenensis TaxID=2484901 RepID=UPI0014386CF5